MQDKLCKNSSTSSTKSGLITIYYNGHTVIYSFIQTVNELVSYKESIYSCSIQSISPTSGSSTLDSRISATRFSLVTTIRVAYQIRFVSTYADGTVSYSNITSGVSDLVFSLAQMRYYGGTDMNTDMYMGDYDSRRLTNNDVGSQYYAYAFIDPMNTDKIVYGNSVNKTVSYNLTLKVLGYGDSNNFIKSIGSGIVTMTEKDNNGYKCSFSTNLST